MRLSNEPEQSEGLLGQLIKLQTEFSARLTEETIRYLRRLQGMAAPAAPGTVVLPGETSVVEAAGQPGGSANIELEVENRQRVHTVVSASLTAMVAASGVTWFPQGEVEPALLIVAPAETRLLTISVPIPTEIPEDTYRGAVLMPGFTESGVPIAVAVETPKAERQATRAKKTTAKKTTAKKTTAKKTTAKKASSKTTAKQATTNQPSGGGSAKKRSPKDTAESGGGKS